MAARRPPCVPVQKSFFPNHKSFRKSMSENCVCVQWHCSSLICPGKSRTANLGQQRHAAQRPHFDLSRAEGRRVANLGWELHRSSNMHTNTPMSDACLHVRFDEAKGRCDAVFCRRVSCPPTAGRAVAIPSPAPHGSGHLPPPSPSRPSRRYWSRTAFKAATCL